MTATFPASSIDAVMGPDKLFYHQVASIGPATRQSIDYQHAMLIREIVGLLCWVVVWLCTR